MNTSSSNASASPAATDVCLTIDTEFSIAGAFEDPDNRAPVGEDYVMCPTRSGGSGLGFILDTLAEHDLRATFFVETLNTSWFGDAPMGTVTERILAAGHDVQLHLHPCWLYFERTDWKSEVASDPPTDRCDGREVEDLAALLGRGVATLERWGVNEVIAFRTGNLFVDRAVYEAMSRVGLALGSNIGLGEWRPADTALQVSCGRHWFGDVLELPVTSYVAAGLRSRASPRLFTVAGTSASEARYLLDNARVGGVSPIVILTHPFEFAHGAEGGAAQARPHGVNRRRLAALCRYLAENRDRFRVRTFTDGNAEWRSLAAADGIELHVPMGLSLPRMVENKLAELPVWP